MMTPTLIHDPDLLARIAVMETAVYDPPRLGHEFIVRPAIPSFPDSPFLSCLCKHCNIVRGVEQWPSDKQPCPVRPIPDPDWPCCLLLADIFEEHGDMVTAAWWRWLESEKKVPTSPKVDGRRTWDWWPPENGYEQTRSPHAVLEWELYRRLAKGGSYDDHGIYPTRRAAYADLKRVWCQQHAATEGS